MSTTHYVPQVAQEAGGATHAGPMQIRTRSLPTPVRRALRSRVVELATTPHGIDAYLQVVNPLWSIGSRRALLVDRQKETRDTSTLVWDPGPDWGPHVAGQHVQLSLDLDGRRRTRHFSVSSSAARDDGCFTTTVKANDDGVVSRFLHAHARTGLVIEVSDPQGEFVLPDPRPDDVLLVSGGSGITPLMSMLRTMLDEGHDGKIRFLHYARTSADRIFGSELDALAERHQNLDVVTVLTAEDGSGPLSGHICADHLAHLTPDWTEVDTFACGPGPMLEAVDELWEHEGAAERLHVEHFELHGDLGAGPGEGTVRLGRSDIEIDDDGRPLLVQAEEAGLEPEYGCRMGICKTCTTRKRSGATQNLTSGDVSREDDDDIQICVSVALGDVELEL